MLQKNIERSERRNRNTWVGYAPRYTKTKRESLDSQRNKYEEDNYWDDYDE